MELHQYIANEGRGAVTRLARDIGAPIPDVYRWSKKKRPVPAHRCSAIESATQGAVTRIDLRPDDYWLIWPDLPAPELAHEEGGHA